MEKFKQIAKKKFVEDMVNSLVILISGGYTLKTLDDAKFEGSIIECCENLDIDNEEQCTCIAHSNHIERHCPNGDVSRLYFDTEGVKTFYGYKNIRIVETKFSDTIKRNYVVYLCV